jgi:hypothetical protein
MPWQADEFEKLEILITQASNDPSEENLNLLQDELSGKRDSLVDIVHTTPKHTQHRSTLEKGTRHTSFLTLHR